jgi:hypothetical protein
VGIWEAKVTGTAVRSLNEADTRAKLINPALYSSDWTDDLMKSDRILSAPELASLSAFPTSDHAALINDTVIPVEGGYTAR